MTCDVLVAGGGITGLATAYSLLSSRPSLRVVLVEASDRLGGTIRTERTEGFLIDAGPDSFVAQRPQGRELCEELGLGAELIRPEPAARKVYLRTRGGLRSMPEGMILGLPTSAAAFWRSGFVSPLGKLRMALDLVLPRGGDPDESIAAFVRRRFGAEAVEAIAEPLLAGIHSGRADELSLAATFPQLLELERKHRSVILGLRRAARAAGERGTAFLSLRGGMGDLVRAVAERLSPVAIRLGAPATALSPDRDGWAVTIGAKETTRASAVVLAIRSHVAAPLCAPWAPDLAAALSAFTSASSAVAFLAFERDQVEHPLDAFGFVSRPGEGRVKAATFVSSKFTGRAPPGRVLLRAFLGDARDEGVLALPDDELCALARRELGELLGIRGDPLFARLYRYDRGTPQPRVGHARRVAALRACEARHKGLFIAGGGYEGIGIPECIRQAREAARKALAVLDAR